MCYVLKNRTEYTKHMDTPLLTALITSKIRIKILMRLFLNPVQQAYLRELADDFQVAPSQVSVELQQLSKAGLLINKKTGRTINYQANMKHPLFPELHSMVKKSLGMDAILESVIHRLGNLEQAMLIDDYAEGKDTGIIDLLLIGDIDLNNLYDLTKKTEKYIDRKIRTLTLSSDEYENMSPCLNRRPRFLLWQQDDSTT